MKLRRGAKARLKDIELFVFDVDGVLTDGGLWYGAEGEVQKRFNVKDGHGLVMARLVGLRGAILTARTSAIVEKRGTELKLAAIMQGQRDKGPAFLALCKSLDVAPEKASYMGDDTNDLAPMALAGLSACPSDAVSEVRAAVQLVSSHPGGQGAARELVDTVLKAKGLYGKALEAMGVDTLVARKLAR